MDSDIAGPHEAEKRHFEPQFRDAVLALRGALLGLYRDVAADPSKPREAARQLKLNKNLTWKLARIIQAESPFDAATLLPGTGGLSIFLEAMEQAGAPQASMQRAREAIGFLEETIGTHVGDRAALELMLDSIGTSEGQLEKSRRLAFRGNAGIMGIHAETRYTAQFIAPNPTNPDMLDAAMVSGVVNVRRLRRIPAWTLFRLGRYAPKHASYTIHPVDAAADACPGLIAESCRGRLPSISVEDRGDDRLYRLGDGPIGRTGEFSCAIGFIDREFAPRWATDDDEMASIFSAVSMPVESIQIDLFVHRDLPEARRLESAVYCKPWSETGETDEAAKLPMRERITSMGSGADVSTPRVEGYSGLIDTTFDRAGWKADEFHCMRMLIDYPPVPSTVAIRFALPRRPGA